MTQKAHLMVVGAKLRCDNMGKMYKNIQIGTQKEGMLEIITNEQHRLELDKEEDKLMHEFTEKFYDLVGECTFWDDGYGYVDDSSGDLTLILETITRVIIDEQCENLDEDDRNNFLALYWKVEQIIEKYKKLGYTQYENY